MEEYANRKTPRLQGFDYNSVGAYFITICTQNRRCILSRIVWTGRLSLQGLIVFFRNLYLRLSGFVTKNTEKTSGNLVLTIILFVIERIMRNICGISAKILCVGNLINYIPKNNLYRKTKRSFSCEKLLFIKQY